MNLTKLETSKSYLRKLTRSQSKLFHQCSSGLSGLPSGVKAVRGHRRARGLASQKMGLVLPEPNGRSSRLAQVSRIRFELRKAAADCTFISINLTYSAAKHEQSRTSCNVRAQVLKAATSIFPSRQQPASQHNNP